MKHKGLGKGLSDLLKEDVVPVGNELVKLIDIDKIEAGIYQPRKNFEYDKLKELSDSISKDGLLQPIIVCPTEKGRFQIVAGERRWRACKLAGFNDIPVIIKNLTNQELLRISLIENIQREELSVIEEAEGYARLIEEFSYTQDQLAQMLSKSRSHIANLLRLNQLPQSIKDKVIQGQLTMGHARCLIGHDQSEQMAQYIIENDLSVRKAEELVKTWHKNEYTKFAKTGEKSRKILQDGSKENELELLAHSLSKKFGVKITIEDYPMGGKLIFHYENLEKLDDILSIFS